MSLCLRFTLCTFVYNPMGFSFCSSPVFSSVLSDCILCFVLNWFVYLNPAIFLSHCRKYYCAFPIIIFSRFNVPVSHVDPFLSILTYVCRYVFNYLFHLCSDLGCRLFKLTLIKKMIPHISPAFTNHTLHYGVKKQQWLFHMLHLVLFNKSNIPWPMYGYIKL